MSRPTGGDLPRPSTVGPSRRQLLRGALAAGVLVGGAELARSRASAAGDRPRRDTPQPLIPTDAVRDGLRDVDVVVVGSGGGGGPVAARLAEAGYSVLVLEAGGLVDDSTYRVPAFSLKASADPQTNWNFLVQHYTDAARHGPRWIHGSTDRTRGMLYPRAASVGGCTSHHAMLMLQPDPKDWIDLAAATGEPSFSPTEMQRHYRSVRQWLPIETANPALLLADRKAARITAGAALAAGATGRAAQLDLNRPSVAGATLDPDDPALVEAGALGLFTIPQSTRNGRRVGTRERLTSAMQAHPSRLWLQTHALVERVLIETDDTGRRRATGVQLRYQPHSYQADPMATAASASPEPFVVRARHEVIIAGGAFNSPQLLMLSGIGPSGHLRSMGITPVVDQPAVGTNLQDRYEVSVVSRYPSDFTLARDCTFGAAGDPCLTDWQSGSATATYASNGILAGAKARSAGGDRPDLFVFGSPARFEGYQPGFETMATAERNRFTWAILKGYSRNRTGTVRLRSADPTDTPEINFRYFGDGALGDGAREDLAALREGVALARSMNRRADSLALTDGETGVETFPGPEVDSDAELDTFIQRHAWGHHASCSNPMGRRGATGAVVDERFRVQGVDGLRVVDASVFPAIPGLFIVLPLYTLAEKAAETILTDLRDAS